MKRNALNYRSIQLGVGAITLGAIGFILLSNLESENRILFAPSIVISTLIAGLTCFVLNRKTLMLACFTCCAGLCLFLKEEQDHMQWQNSLVKVAHFNLDGEISEVKLITQQIIDSEADILSIQEIPPSLISALHNQLMVEGYKNFYYQNDVSKAVRDLVVYSKYDMVLSKNTARINPSLLVGKLKIPSNNQYQEVHFISSRFISPSILSENISLPYQAPFFVFGDLYRNKDDVNQNTRATISTDHIFYSNHFNCISFERINCASKEHLGVRGVYQLKNQSDGISKISYKEL